MATEAKLRQLADKGCPGYYFYSSERYLVRQAITAKNATGACKKMQTLLRLQQEPIAITAAMIGSYVDLYRVKLGAAKRKNYSTVFKDFGYKGSDYRLKRSAETASHYTLGQIENCMQVLLELDQSLKSQPTDDQILLETALCRLAMAGSGR